MGAPKNKSSRDQTWDPDSYVLNAGFVAELGEPVLNLLRPKRGERILDLGCGDGRLTEKIAATGALVTGIDSSPEQVAAAQSRGLDVQIMDGEDIVNADSFTHEFDGVFSNAALHWMRRPQRVIAGVRGVLKDGGRFVGEFGGKGNVEIIARALIEALNNRGLDGESFFPWYFPDAGEYSKLLQTAGFDVHHSELFDRPTPIPGELSAWLETFAESFLMAVEPGGRSGFMEEVRSAVKPLLQNAEGEWTVDYVRLRFAAVKRSNP